MSSSLLDSWHAGAVGLDVLLASQGPPAGLIQRRQRRLAALLEAAKASPLYRERIERHGTELPPIAKRELMDRFADWVTDPRLALPGLRDFAADPSRIGELFAGEFVVWESSGSSGESAVFVQDRQAMAAYDALEALRRAAAAPWRRWADPFYLGERIAFVGATGGHFASTVSMERLRRLGPGLPSHLRSFSFLEPTAQLVESLEQHQPTIIATYPSAALLLAEEAAAQRLHIAPREIWTGGEAMSEGMRSFIERTFGCCVRANYGASEFLPMASECEHHGLHLNSDWVILEPVDEQYRPVPLGETGATVLLTNLANHVQPVIRYDLGDCVRFHAERCACGSPLPLIEVQGRIDDMLVLRDDKGADVRLLPLALTTVLEDDAGVFDFQLVLRGPRALSLTVSGEGGEAALGRARDTLSAYLLAQGLGKVKLDVRHGPPPERGRSGKVPRVVAQQDPGMAFAEAPVLNGTQRKRHAHR